MANSSNKTEHFDEDSIILNTGVLIFDLMMLNVMWFICSLPVVTIGLSTTAMNYTCIKIRNDEGDSVVRMFFHSLKENFKPGLFLGTGMVAVLIILFAGLFQFIGTAAAGHTSGIILSVVMVLLLFLWLTMFVFIFMVLSRFDNTPVRTITNSIYLAVKNPFTACKVFMIASGMLVILPIILWTCLPYLFPMLIFFVIPVTAYLEAGVFNKLFEKFIR